MVSPHAKGPAGFKGEDSLSPAPPGSVGIKTGHSFLLENLQEHGRRPGTDNNRGGNGIFIFPGIAAFRE